MKITSNDLYCEIESYDDPGDYPNNLASGPLPSEQKCIFGGEMIIEAENDEDVLNFKNVNRWIKSFVAKHFICESNISPVFNYEVTGNTCTVTILDADVEEIFDERDEYDPTIEAEREEYEEDLDKYYADLDDDFDF